MKTSFLNSFSNRTWRYSWIYVDMCELHKHSFAPIIFVLWCSESPAEIKCVRYGKPTERTRCLKCFELVLCMIWLFVADIFQSV